MNSLTPVRDLIQQHMDMIIYGLPELEELSTYAESLDDALSHRKASITKKTGKPKDYYELEAYAYQVQHYEELIPEVLWKSMLLTAYGIFEYRLADICKTIHSYLCQAGQPSDPPSDCHIKGSAEYLGNMLSDKQGWKKIELRASVQIFQELRNKIAHNGGIIEKESDLYEKLAKMKGVTIDENTGWLKLSKDFFKYSVKIFTKQLYSVVKIVSEENWKGEIDYSWMFDKKDES